MNSETNDELEIGDLLECCGIFGVTERGASITTARPLYEIAADGTLTALRLTPEEEAELEKIDPYERDYTPQMPESTWDTIVEIVRVQNCREVSRWARVPTVD